MRERYNFCREGFLKVSKFQKFRLAERFIYMFYCFMSFSKILYNIIYMSLTPHSSLLTPHSSLLIPISS